LGKAEIFTFGFINTTYKNHKILEGIDDIEGNILIKQLSNYNDMTHMGLIRLFFNNLNGGILTLQNGNTVDFSNTDQKKNFTDNFSKIFSYDSRIFLQPSGRMWKNAATKNGVKNIISFWDTKNNYDYVKIIDKILNSVNINDEEKDRTLIEFPIDYIDYGSENKEMYTFGEYKNNKTNKNDEITEDDIDILNRLEIPKIGAHGNILNPKFGSSKQFDIANKSGYDTFAKYYASRHPFTESKNNSKR
jgi:hypothetical protein